MKLNQADMENALQFLADTDVDFARAQALYNGLSEQSKTIKSVAYGNAGGMMMGGDKKITDKARDNAAYCSPAYVQHLAKVEVANMEYLTLRAQRSTKAIIIDCWRSLNSARSKGQVV